jgi:hypothetical protein
MMDRLPGENVAVGAGTAESSAIPTGTGLVYLCSDADCYVSRGTTGGSVTSSNGQYLPANAIIPYPVVDGEVILVTQKDGSSGNLNVARARPA